MEKKTEKIKLSEARVLQQIVLAKETIQKQLGVIEFCQGLLAQVELADETPEVSK